MKSRTMAHLGEFGWLKTLLPRLYWPQRTHPQLWIGPGDDAGALGITRGCGLVATTDAFVEGIHFDRRWGRWESLGEKILAVNLSDLAAMGAVRPLAALVSAAFPGDTPVDIVNKLYTGMKRCAQRWKAGFLGGDTVGSPRGIFISVTLFGEAKKQGLLRRDSARAGEWLVSSGPCGLAGAGLEVLQQGKSSLPWTKPLVDAFCTPRPRMPEGAWLARHAAARSLMDISDGLAASARLLAEASGVGVRLDLERLIIAPSLTRWARGQKKDPLDYALYGGEDYELLYSIRSERWKEIKTAWPRAQVIGEIRSKKDGCWAVHGSQRIPLTGYGYSHFARS